MRRQIYFDAGEYWSGRAAHPSDSEQRSHHATDATGPGEEFGGSKPGLLGEPPLSLRPLASALLPLVFFWSVRPLGRVSGGAGARTASTTISPSKPKNADQRRAGGGSRQQLFAMGPSSTRDGALHGRARLGLVRRDRASSRMNLLVDLHRTPALERPSASTRVRHGRPPRAEWAKNHLVKRLTSTRASAAAIASSPRGVRVPSPPSSHRLPLIAAIRRASRVSSCTPRVL